MTTIFDYVEKSAEYDTHKADYTDLAAKMSFDHEARLIVPPQLFGSVPPLSLTTWAWYQVYSKMVPMVYGKGSNKSTLPTDYLPALRPDLRAYVLNDHIKNGANGTGWMVRAYDETCRAVVSDGFATIGNTELLDTFAGVVKEQHTPDFQLIRPAVTPDEMYLKSVWKDVQAGGKNYGLGVFMSNSEIGGRKIRIKPVVQKHSCTNSIIVDHEKGIELTHRGSRITKMILIKAAIAEIFGLAAEALDRLVKAESEVIPNFSDVLLGLTAHYGWDDKTSATVSIGTEGNQTRAGIINGVTYAAHAVEREAAEQAEMEMLGGKMLTLPADFFYQMAERVHHK
jgi:hypothetical protein